jgi:ATPase subunit of ABC transporter with duplicated ATPase domains
VFFLSIQVATELEWVQQSPKARQAKSKARLKQYDELVSRQPSSSELAASSTIFIPPGPRLGDVVIDAVNLRKEFKNGDQEGGVGGGQRQESIGESNTSSDGSSDSISTSTSGSGSASDGSGNNNNNNNKLLFDGLDFSLPRSGIVGVVGPNGAGKTTLMRMLNRELMPDGGRLVVGETVKMVTVGQVIMGAPVGI